MTRSTTSTVFLLLAVAGSVLAADPVVTGVSVNQRADGSGLVDIRYNVSDADGDSLYVSFRASIDGGASWRFPIYTLSGHAGAGVPPGNARQAVWNLRADHPDLVHDDVRVTVIASDLDVSHETHSPGRYSVLHFGSASYDDPELIEKIARADLLVLTAGIIWDSSRNERLPIIEQIRQQNPDCRTIGYVSAKTVRLDWQTYPPDSYFGRLWAGCSPFISYTTEGDTLMDYPGAAVVNILEPECRRVIIDAIAEQQTTSSNAFDGIYWDYFNHQIWVPDTMPVEGRPDLDRDGIPMDLDEDEQLAYQQACEDLVLGVRAELGEDFIQIFNGQRAYSDSSFAALSDGVVYELFPDLFFPGGEPMRTALDPDFEHNFFHTMTWPRTVNGGPYTIIQNKVLNYYFPPDGPRILPSGNFLRAVGLLTDAYCAWHPEGKITYGWPVNPLNLGEPLGPTTIEGDVFRRAFEYGDIELIMGSGSMPVPFRYWIRTSGVVVETLDFPTVDPPGPLY